MESLQYDIFVVSCFPKAACSVQKYSFILIFCCIPLAISDDSWYNTKKMGRLLHTSHLSGYPIPKPN